MRQSGSSSSPSKTAITWLLNALIPLMLASCASEPLTPYEKADRDNQVKEDYALCREIYRRAGVPWISDVWGGYRKVSVRQMQYEMMTNGCRP